MRDYNQDGETRSTLNRSSSKNADGRVAPTPTRPEKKQETQQRPGPTVLLRTDMDALPIEEETGVPYASHVVVKSDSGASIPLMHACGHDIHMSSWIGTAKLMASNQDLISFFL
jgi:hypothetical protein